MSSIHLGGALETVLHPNKVQVIFKGPGPGLSRDFSHTQNGTK
jgi:hypothetical protein